MKYTLIPLCIWVLVGCAGNPQEAELATLQQELTQIRAERDSLAERAKGKGDFVHLVFLKIKPDVDSVGLIQELQKLSEIEQVTEFTCGFYEEVDDPRALSEYHFMMKLRFESEEAYQTYQQHPLHAASKAATKEMLAGPPATWDFVAK